MQRNKIRRAKTHILIDDFFQKVSKFYKCVALPIPIWHNARSTVIVYWSSNFCVYLNWYEYFHLKHRFNDLGRNSVINFCFYFLSKPNGISMSVWFLHVDIEHAKKLNMNLFWIKGCIKIEKKCSSFWLINCVLISAIDNKLWNITTERILSWFMWNVCWFISIGLLLHRWLKWKSRKMNIKLRSKKALY